MYRKWFLTRIPAPFKGIGMPKVSKLKGRRLAGDDDEAVPSIPPIVPPLCTVIPSAKAATIGAAKNKKNGADGKAPGASSFKSAIKEEGSPDDVDGLVASSDTVAFATGGLKRDEDDDNNNDYEIDSIDGSFDDSSEYWNSMLYQLMLYKAQQGDLNVPNNDAKYTQLYNWIQRQRAYYQEKNTKSDSLCLSPDRIAVLDAIDFQWNLRGDNFWQKNFDGLITYKKQCGDVRVPRLYDKNPKLGEWVTDQRRQWKAKCDGRPNSMTEERKAKLDAVGFVWQVRDRSDWNDRYEKLLEFKKESGHCIVPQHYPPNRSLGKWVAKQREQYRFYREGKHSFLTEERIDLLKAAGFVWQIKGRNTAKNKGKKGKTENNSNTIKMENDDENEEGVEEEVDDFQDAHDDIEMGAAVPDAGGSMPPLPVSNMTMTQQQLLLQHVAAAQGRSNQHIVMAQLAAAMGLGGGGGGVTAMGEQIAALRAAQLMNGNVSDGFSTHV